MSHSGRLHANYKRAIEGAFTVALLLLIFIFYSFSVYESTEIALVKPNIETEWVEIPKTEQFERKPPPARPSIPVEADEDEILDDVSIEFPTVDQDLHLTDVPPPPKDDAEVFYEFYAVSEKPVLLRRVDPYYPEIPQKAGIEGSVTVKVLIDKQGNIAHAEMFKSNPLFDEAALSAAKQFKFKPGKQRDKYVKVWMYIPFHFRLRN